MNKFMTLEQAIQAYSKEWCCGEALKNSVAANPTKWKNKTTVDMARNYLTMHSAMFQVFFATTDDWYPAFTLDGGKYVQATLRKWDSNLDLYTICLAGNDDYSISKDYLDLISALADWNYLYTVKSVNSKTLSDTYFSN